MCNCHNYIGLRIFAKISGWSFVKSQLTFSVRVFSYILVVHFFFTNELRVHTMIEQLYIYQPDVRQLFFTMNWLHSH